MRRLVSLSLVGLSIKPLHTEGCCLGVNEFTLTVTDPQENSDEMKIWVEIAE
jgi:hypothetical protein